MSSESSTVSCQLNGSILPICGSIGTGLPRILMARQEFSRMSNSFNVKARCADGYHGKAKAGTAGLNSWAGRSLGRQVIYRSGYQMGHDHGGTMVAPNHPIQ